VKVLTVDTYPKVSGFLKSSPGIDFPKEEVEGSIPERFEKIAKLYPDRIAIKFKETSLTYRQFDQRTNQVAQLIWKENKSSGEPVAFLLSNIVESIIAIFGILKAGGGYLSLDPAFPIERLKNMLEDSEARIVITNKDDIDLAREISLKDTVFVNLDDISSDISTENLQLEISPYALSCLYYTSGSTGKPKGVPHFHRNTLHVTWLSVNRNRCNQDDRIALAHSTSFAASVNAIFGALLTGACLCPVDLKEGLSSLADWLQDEEITIFSGVSTLFRHLAMSLKKDQEFPHLRLITGGGEAFLKSDVELYKKHFSKYSILSHGIGGTEMHTFRTILIDRDTEITSNVVPVGYPVEDKEVLIFDEDGKQVGFNEVGEIVIRSQYLSPGYWKNPELTKEKFKDDPDHPGMRLYLTGDLGRMEDDGCLYHMGRKDFQVKIRGFRVELGGVESVLMQHEGVNNAAVVVDESPGMDKRLIGYFVTNPDYPTPTSEELRIYLKDKLPDYMVPSAYIMLDSMPLTATGKIDRLALPAMEDIFHLDEDYVPPSNETEKKLVKIWENVLGLGQIGIKHDFFQLGGYSLLAAKLVTKIEEEFGVRFELDTLTEAPTIEEQAELLKVGVQPNLKSCLVPIQADGNKPPLYCVHGAGGHILPFLKLASYLGSEQPVIGIQSKDLEERKGKEYTLEVMASDYVQEIIAYQPEGPYLLAGFSFGGFVAFEMAKQLSAQGYEIGLLSIFDTQVASAPRFLTSISMQKSLAYRTKSLMKRIEFHTQNISKLSYRELPGYLKKKRVRPSAQEAIMGDVEEEEVPEHMLRVIKANIATLKEYIPGEYEGKVVVFKSDYHGRGIYYGWQELARGGVEIHYIPGSHRGILQEPNVALLAEKLRNCIDNSSSLKTR